MLYFYHSDMSFYCMVVRRVWALIPDEPGPKFCSSSYLITWASYLTSLWLSSLTCSTLPVKLTLTVIVRLRWLYVPRTESISPAWVFTTGSPLPEGWNLLVCLSLLSLHALRSSVLVLSTSPASMYFQHSLLLINFNWNMFLHCVHLTSMYRNLFYL